MNKQVVKQTVKTTFNADQVGAISLGASSSYALYQFAKRSSSYSGIASVTNGLKNISLNHTFSGGIATLGGTGLLVAFGFSTIYRRTLFNSVKNQCADPDKTKEEILNYIDNSFASSGLKAELRELLEKEYKNRYGN